MTSSDTEVPRPALVFDGTVGDLYRIFLLNLLLNIVTLGIWRFWGITRMRRYVWSRTSSGGSRFEYDGTGRQLFAGFLLATGAIFSMFAIAGGVSALLVHEHVGGALGRVLPIILVEIFVIVLAMGAVFSAQRYRLSHTVWRGIRGGMKGSMIAYGLQSLLYYLLVVLTFYQLYPWASLRLLERRINASAFGTQFFVSRGKPGRLYLRFLATFAGIVLLGAVLAVLVYALEAPLFAAFAHASRGEPLDPHIATHIVAVLLPAYLVFFVGAALIGAGYSAAFFRHVAGHTTLGALSFSSSVTAAGVLSLIVGNLLILLLTLGLGMPFVIRRNVVFFTTNLLATGTLDLAAIGQSEQPASRFGEGMFQALDAGAGIG